MKSRHLDFIGTHPHAFSVGNVARCTGRGVADRLVSECRFEPQRGPAAGGLVQSSFEGRGGRKWNQDALIPLAEMISRETRVSPTATRVRNDGGNLGS